MNRRDLLKTTGAVFLAASPLRGETLPAWSEGTLDIHHISTGRGSCAFMILPDGTTMMVDAGATASSEATAKFLIAPKPDGSRRPGEWIARYVSRQLLATGRHEIDYFLLTHFHIDHFGAVADVAQAVPIRKLIDRDYPDYSYPVPFKDRYYRDFVSSFVAKGGTAEKLHVGSASQIRLVRKPDTYPDFRVRNIAASGVVWTGEGEKTVRRFPDLGTLHPSQYPTENMCSLGVRIEYGRFRYYTGGDMPFDTNYGRDLWRDIESAAAHAAGPVDVAVADHHGYVDATGPEFVRTLRPRAWVINAWDSAHPTIPALHAMLSTVLYPGERDIYTTAIKPEALIATRRLAELKSNNGHVVFRVPRGGESFQVLITSNEDESDRVIHSFGPYQTKGSKS